MALVGADVGQLRVLARTMTEAAERLEGSVGVVNSVLSGVQWAGRDGDSFRSQWHNESQARVRSVAAALRAAAKTVLRNADEQDQASAAGSGSGTFGAFALAPGWTHPTPGIDFNQSFNPLVGIRDFLNSSPVWPITWGTALGAFDDKGVLPLLDAIGLAGDSRLGPEEKLTEAMGSLADLGAGRLKSAGTPVGYLSGVAVSQWSDVVTAAGQADFSPSTVKTVTDYVASDPGGAFNAAKDAVVGYVPKLFSNLVPW